MDICPLIGYTSGMTSQSEMTLKIIGHIKTLFIDMIDPGDWAPGEFEEANELAETFTNWMFDSLSLSVASIEENGSFTLSGTMENAKNFMNEKLTNPLDIDL